MAKAAPFIGNRKTHVHAAGPSFYSSTSLSSHMFSTSSSPSVVSQIISSQIHLLYSLYSCIYLLSKFLTSMIRDSFHFSSSSNWPNYLIVSYSYSCFQYIYIYIFLPFTALQAELFFILILIIIIYEVFVVLALLPMACSLMFVL